MMTDDVRCCWMKLGLVRTETGDGDGRFGSTELGLVCLSKIGTWSD